jgi:hypothetical protein
LSALTLTLSLRERAKNEGTPLSLRERLRVRGPEGS